MITQSKLKELLHYDPETGVFTSKTGRGGMGIGKVAGTPHSEGYIHIGLNYKTYFSHRLAWLYVYGEWPECIDHINHMKTDNRLVNLRSIPRGANSKNMPRRKDNKSGATGIYWIKRLNKWSVRIKDKGRMLSIGYYENKFDALCARKSAETKYGYHYNHGA